MPMREASLDELTIDDEAAFDEVALYPRLKQALRESGHRFLLPATGTETSWDRALFLNLTFWSAEEGVDVLCEARLPADVVAHAAWHHVVSRSLAREAGGAGAPSAAGLFFAESIASAFDLYLVGSLLRAAPDTDFITTQVPIMHEAATEAGLSDAAFRALLDGVCEDPARAFEELRALLFDATTALFACADARAAAAALDGYAGHRFAPLLHHYQLSNWILFARAYADGGPERAAAVRRIDEALRASNDGLAWLARHWLDAG